MKRSTQLLLLGVFIEVLIGAEAFAAKKDFKGLFGSYRREKFTENEAGSGEIGVDILLSTLLPVTPEEIENRTDMRSPSNPPHVQGIGKSISRPSRSGPKFEPFRRSLPCSVTISVDSCEKCRRFRWSQRMEEAGVAAFGC